MSIALGPDLAPACCAGKLIRGEGAADDGCTSRTTDPSPQAASITGFTPHTLRSSPKQDDSTPRQQLPGMTRARKQKPTCAPHDGRFPRKSPYLRRGWWGPLRLMDRQLPQGYRSPLWMVRSEPVERKGGSPLCTQGSGPCPSGYSGWAVPPGRWRLGRTGVTGGTLKRGLKTVSPVEMGESGGGGNTKASPCVMRGLTFVVVYE